MRVLVTGGAGYIGSVVTAAPAGRRPRGDGARRPVDRPRRRGARRGRASSRPSLHDSAPVLADVGPTAVLHFAAKCLVGESVAAARGLLAHQRRRLARAARGDARRRLPADRLLLDRGHLRRARVGADPRGRADPADQPLRRLQARRRPHAHLVRGRARLRRGEPALLQRGRRRRRARRAARDRDPPHPDRAAGRGRAAGVAHRLRRRLPDPGRHLHPRLRPRRRPRRRAPAGAARPGRRRAPDLQPGQRHRLLGAGGGRRRAAR